MPLSDTDTLQLKLIFAEAERRHLAATLLANVPADTSDSGYLLELLALELLLKAAVRLHAGRSERGHNYAALFAALPADIQATILASASRNHGSFDSSRVAEQRDLLQQRAKRPRARGTARRSALRASRTDNEGR